MFRTMNYHEIPHHVNVYLFFIAVTGTFGSILKEKWTLLIFELVNIGLSLTNVMAFYVFKEAHNYLPYKKKVKEDPEKVSALVWNKVPEKSDRDESDE